LWGMARMHLTGLQKILWVAAGVAALAYGALMVFSDRAPVSVAEAAFRPTFSLPDAEGRLRTPADFAGKHLLVHQLPRCLPNDAG
jgi:protein SCO1/2